MPFTPDLSDPRYLDEVGWFLYHEKYERDQFGGSYHEERLAYSRLLRDEVLSYCGQDEQWLGDKTIVSIGCGCTGDLAAWPAAVKIAADPLLYTYQQLGMLVGDVAGSPTVYLAVAGEALPLLDACADLVICRNALDHMPDPQLGLQQISRILKEDAHVFLSVDLGENRHPMSRPSSQPRALSGSCRRSGLRSSVKPMITSLTAADAPAPCGFWRARNREPVQDWIATAFSGRTWRGLSGTSKAMESGWFSCRTAC